MGTSVECGKTQLLTAAEVAERLRIGRQSVYQLCRKPGFPVVRIGGLIRVPTEALERWIEQQSSMSEPETEG